MDQHKIDFLAREVIARILPKDAKLGDYPEIFQVYLLNSARMEIEHRHFFYMENDANLVLSAAEKIKKDWFELRKAFDKVLPPEGS